MYGTLWDRGGTGTVAKRTGNRQGSQSDVLLKSSTALSFMRPCRNGWTGHRLLQHGLVPGLSQLLFWCIIQSAWLTRCSAVANLHLIWHQFVAEKPGKHPSSTAFVTSWRGDCLLLVRKVDRIAHRSLQDDRCRYIRAQRPDRAFV